MFAVLFPNMAYVQNTCVNVKGSPALGEYVERNVDDSLKLDIACTPKGYPSKLKGGIVPDEKLVEWGKTNRPLVFEKYTHSSSVTDEGLCTEALTMLADRGYPGTISDAEVELILDMFLCIVATQPLHYTEADEVSAENLVRQMTSQRSSGHLNVDTSSGAGQGTKEQCITAAALCAVASTQLLSTSVAPKSEVLKAKGKFSDGTECAGKKVRQICTPAFPVHLKACLLYGEAARKHGLVANLDFTGVSKVDGNQTKWLLNSFLHENAVEQKTWDEFLRDVSKVGVCEADKKKWEATVNRASCLAFVLSLIAETKVRAKDRSHQVQVLADYCCPFIKYNGHRCYAAPWCVGSGNLLTLKGNNWRHIAGTVYSACHVQRHGGQWYTPGCQCYVCPTLTERGVKNDNVSQVQLARMTSGGLLGDDRIMVDPGYQACELVDAVLGTHTVYENRPLEEAEFLRCRLKVSDQGFVSFFRDEERILGKLLHGEAQKDRSRLAAAIHSATLEAGDNEALNLLLHDLYDSLELTEDEAQGARDYELEFVYRGVLPGENPLPMSIEQVRLRHNQMEGAFLDLKIGYELCMSC